MTKSWFSCWPAQKKLIFSLTSPKKVVFFADQPNKSWFFCWPAQKKLIFSLTGPKKVDFFADRRLYPLPSPYPRYIYIYIELYMHTCACFMHIHGCFHRICCLTSRHTSIQKGGGASRWGSRCDGNIHTDAWKMRMYAYHSKFTWLWYYLGLVGKQICSFGSSRQTNQLMLV